MAFFDIFTPIIEVTVIAVIMNYLLYFFKKSSGLLIGLGVFFVLFSMSSVFGLPVLYTIMTNFMNIAAMGLMIIFQPELRTALSKLTLKGKRYQEVTEFDKFLDQLTRSVYFLAEKRAGALIAIENMDPLDEFAQKAVMLNAKFSSELVETIFGSMTPLHDGAIIIRNGTILAACAIFPLADDAAILTRSMGTRHRAALGLSQKVDALVIAISEESGKVSLVREGKFSPDVKMDKFQGVLQSLYGTEEQRTETQFSRIKEWIRGT